MEKPDWNALLQQALTLPGTLSKAYSVFHDYSLGNAILAAFQLAARGLPLAPIASFNRWKNLGRKVRKGEKALSLIMPVTVKRKDKDEVTLEEGTSGAYMIFFDEAQLVQSRPDGRRCFPAGGMDAGVG
jgi:antirestriction protein ArdC